MYQVKKQLQDAIKKLKSDWGINEVKREDLAAVLEKVVAALDRAAQLPVAPVQPAYVGGVIVAEKKYADEEGISIKDSNAPLGCIPVLYGQRGSDSPELLMYDESSGNIYRYTGNGNTVRDEYKNHIFLCESNILMFNRFDGGAISDAILSISLDLYVHQ